MREIKDDYLQQLVDEKILVRVYVDDDFEAFDLPQPHSYLLYEGTLISYSILGVSLILANAMKIWIPINRLARIIEFDNSNDAVHEKMEVKNYVDNDTKISTRFF